MQRILLIDDQENFCIQVQKALSLYEIPIEYEIDAESGLNRATFELWDAILVDVSLNQNQNGLDILKEVIQKKPQTPMIMISGSSTLHTAVEATKIGAYDFLEKPLDVDRLRLTITRALEKNRLTMANQALLDEIGKQFPLVGTSPAIVTVINEVEQLAPTDAKVLILGGSGVGKDLVAKIVHYRSKRKSGPFISINCSAIPEQLIESELFGYEKGSFTGANERREGFIAKAEGGTLFLDEITDLPMAAQAKLLRFLNDGRYSRLGGTKSIQSDCRIISATNSDIQEEIKSGHFREDLFYRLNVVNLLIPPLRNRQEDISPLANFFLESASKKFGRNITHFSDEAMQIIKKAHWPGNVRQLKSSIFRMVVFSQNNVIDFGTAATALQMDNTPLTTGYPNGFDSLERPKGRGIKPIGWDLSRIF